MGSRGLRQADVFACWDLIVSLGEIGNRGEVPAVHSRDGTKVSCQLSEKLRKDHDYEGHEGSEGLLVRADG